MVTLLTREANMTEQHDESGIRQIGVRVEGELRARLEDECRQRRWPAAEVLRDALEKRYGLGLHTRKPTQG